jgi:hypothetical protein
MVRPSPVHNGSTPMQTHLPTGEAQKACKSRAFSKRSVGPLGGCWGGLG